MEFDNYSEVMKLAKEMKDAGLAGVFVFKPDCFETVGAESYPDMIVASTDDANVISALLGNGSVVKIDEESADDECENDDHQ